jgi:type IV secretory pathway VirB10-like protein
MNAPDKLSAGAAAPAGQQPGQIPPAAGAAGSKSAGGTNAGTAPGPGQQTPKQDENNAQHGKRALIVAAIFGSLVVGGLLVDSLLSTEPTAVAAKVEEPPKAEQVDPFADFDAKQRAELARLEQVARKKAEKEPVPGQPLAPVRTPEQELREAARLEDLKIALASIRSKSMVVDGTRGAEPVARATGNPAAGLGAAGGASKAEATLAQLRQAIDRARAGGGDGAAGGAKLVNASLGGAGGTAAAAAPFVRELSGADAAAAVVGQSASARRERGEGPRPGELLVPVGTVMAAVLDMQISSDWEGRWRALLTRDIYDIDREYVLLPKGTRIMGSTVRARPVNEAINERMALTARWAVLPNGARIDLSRSGVLDTSGVGAIAGDVDRHFLAQLGGTVAYGVIGGLGAVTAAKSVARGDNVAQVALGATAGAEIAGGLVDIGQRVAARYLNLVPTINVMPGTSMVVFLDDELYLTPWSRLEGLGANTQLRAAR